jgi:hypothetical protein
LAATLADPLSQASPAHQIGCNGRIFSFGGIPGNHFGPRPREWWKFPKDLNPGYAGVERTPT